jgi:hypothetical protein
MEPTHCLSKKWKRVWALLLTLLAVVAVEPVPTSMANDSRPEDLDRTIAYLLQHVTQSNLIFIRNGVMHSPKEAAEHMRRKYEYFKKKIRTPEDFIRLCSSMSTVTGRPYQVKLPDGRLLRTDQWMLSALSQYRRETGQLQSIRDQ